MWPEGSALEKLCAQDNALGDDCEWRLAALPNVFSGAKRHRQRHGRLRDDARCTVLCVWRPPADAAVVGSLRSEELESG